VHGLAASVIHEVIRYLVNNGRGQSVHASRSVPYKVKLLGWLGYSPLRNHCRLGPKNLRARSFSQTTYPTTFDGFIIGKILV
jgi:hypothetical protein